MTFLTDIVAQAQYLPLSDSYNFQHYIYKEHLERDLAVIKLNFEAYKIFRSSIQISSYDGFNAEINNSLRNQLTPRPIHSQIPANINLEYFYIATGFELSFKSLLLNYKYLVHEIFNQPELRILKAKQKSEAISISEFMSISNFYYDRVKK